MSIAITGAAFGLVAGAGALLALTRLPPLRTPTLEDRLAPYLRDTPRPSRLLRESRSITPFPTLERVFGPALREGARALERLLTGGGTVARRLERAGRPGTLDAFRAEQITWGATGLLLAGAGSMLSLASGAARSPLALVLACLLSALGGGLARDRWLTRQVERREARILAQFPTIADVLALAVTAGEGAVDAVERVARTTSGELSDELRRALADMRAGTPLVPALTGVAERTGLPVLTRFVDGVAVAVERGTPLADVLRAQAADVREAGRRALLESGGRREIAMMVPTARLILFSHA